jgi:two-component system, LuxR family, sensor kinase FixL
LDLRFQALSGRDRPSQLGGYALAVAAVALVVALHLAAAPLVGGQSPILFFTVAVLVTAFYADRGPALLAVALSAVGGSALFWADGALSAVEAMRLLVFGLVSGGLILFGQQAIRARLAAIDMRVRADAEARRAALYAEELNLLVESAADYAIFMVDPAGAVTIWNKGAERTFGWSEAEAIGRPGASLYAAAEAGKAPKDLALALAEGRLSGERWQIRRDGSEFVAELTITPLRDGEGRLRGYAKVLRDVTDRYAFERAVERRERHLESILDTVPDAMIVIDQRGLILSFSAAAQQMFGYAEEELVGRNVSLLMPSPDRERHNSYLYNYLKTGERKVIGIGRDVTGLRKDGRSFPIELKVGEALSEGQQIFTGFLRDLTERQRTEARVNELQSELVHVSRLSAMGTMATTLAHELNQPLTAIANYAEAADPIVGSDREEDRALLREIFQEMAGQTMRAGGIVRRLREFIARGDIEKRVEDLPELIEEAAALALIGTRERGIAAEIVLDPAATPVLVDRVQIQQVLINLIRNAVEAMEESEVRQLRVSTGFSDAATIRIAVSDTGPGISRSVASQLFQAFVSTKSSGMGLGLSICRTIVEAHGGRIRAGESAEGGAEFEFTLPTAEGENGDSHT